MLPSDILDILLEFYYDIESAALCVMRMLACKAALPSCIAMSYSLKSLKNGCLRAWPADILLSRLYDNNFTITSVQSGETFGISFAIPVPSFLGKLNSMCVASF